MAKKITLRLVISLIMEAVKGETLIKGRVDKATDDKAAALAYQEEAGDEQFHVRKLYRTMYTSLEELKGVMGDYLDSGTLSGGDNVYTVVSTDTDSIELTLSVSDRFNNSFVSSLARLCSKYIEDKMLFLWWGTFNQKQAEHYARLVESDEKAVQRCFTKTAPEVPSTPYTTSIRTDMGDVYRIPVNSEDTLTYIIDSACLDDVEAVSDSPGVLSLGGRVKNGFTVVSHGAGMARVTLYSRHDEDVSHTVTVVVYDD